MASGFYGTSITARAPCSYSSLPTPVGCYTGRSSRQALALRCQVQEAVDVQPEFLTSGRSCFPPGFVFGASSSAYQVEGAWNEGGKGPSIWDTFCDRHPDKIAGEANGKDAIDQYYRFEEDIELMKKMGLDAYRFSISWSRILPKGSVRGGINQAGIDHYNELIDKLIGCGIKPCVTLYHWDLPQALQDEYGGFLNRRIVDDFKDYCDICFKNFGHKVKQWVTLNEPHMFATMGYQTGIGAPGRCSPSICCACPSGDSKTEPYTVGHHLILAHAAAATHYMQKYQGTQQGEIGITLDCFAYAEENESYENRQAVDRTYDFELGWFMDPLTHGEYPFSMRALLGIRLPEFTFEERQMIKGSYNFVGLNYYTGRFARGISMEDNYINVPDSRATRSEQNSRGVLIGQPTGTWIYIYPGGLKKVLLLLKERYSVPAIYVHENGVADSVNGGKLTMEKALEDTRRTKFIQFHLAKIGEAIMAGVNVKGYFYWSLFDSFEWSSGYSLLFGLIYVDRNADFERRKKNSAEWFTNFLKS